MRFLALFQSCLKIVQKKNNKNNNNELNLIENIKLAQVLLIVEKYIN